ncbi:hypothetical protein [Comamonas thiooxydans]|uniref:hypothetical protein n=1 Tax=Comamonas thiooxydans TaxID=363952 RepID=UPI00325FA281
MQKEKVSNNTIPTNSMEAAAAQLAAPIREARRVSYMNIVAAGMAVFAAALALWASL